MRIVVTGIAASLIAAFCVVLGQPGMRVPSVACIEIGVPNPQHDSGDLVCQRMDLLLGTLRSMPAANAEAWPNASRFISLRRAGHSAVARQIESFAPGQPLVVRLRGQPGVRNGRPVLSADGVDPTLDTMDCLSLLEHVVRRDAPALLWIDAELPDIATWQTFPEAEAWAFRDALISELDATGPSAIIDPDVSLAVVIRVHAPELAAEGSDSPAPDADDREWDQITSELDSNANGRVECSEWIRFASGRASRAQRHQASRAQRHLTVAKTLPQWTTWSTPKMLHKDFALTPVDRLQMAMQSKHGDAAVADIGTPPAETSSEATAKTATDLAAQTATEQAAQIATEQAAQTATEQAAQTATDLAPDWLRHEAAPSMAFARLANENRLGTRFADSLPKWSAEFSAFIDSALDRKTFETWINRPELTAVTWVEFEFARRALRTSLPDDVVRDLIRAIRDRAILVTDPSCTTTADARGPDPVWQSFLAETLRVQRELDRQVIDDIRIDKAQASKLAATGKGLLDRLQTIQQAEASLMRLASQAESICGFPVKRFPERHDPVIGLFNKANSLRNLLADRAATTASIEAQWKDFKQDFATLRISSPDNASWDVSEITKIRHSRYSLASRFQNPSGGLTSTQRLSVSLRAMAEQCVRDRSDGNLAERMRRANFVDNCRRLVTQLRQHDSGIPAWDIWVPQRVVNQAEVAGDGLPGNGSFTDKTITVALVARASGGGAPVAGRWTWDCDSKDWFIESASSEHIPRDQQHGRMDLTVRATTTSPRSAILIGRWVTNDDCYRVDVPLVGRKPDFLDWRLRVPSEAGDDPGDPQRAWMMAPNEVETRSLWLRNRDEGVQEVSVRWIAPEDSSGEKPRVLAELAKLPVPVDHEIRVPFPPRKLPPKSPPVSVSQLQIEMVDLATGRVQRNTITPSVRRPFSLLRPRVDFDASTQLVTVHVDPGDAAGSGPIDQVKTMDVTLRRTRDGKAVAQGQWRGNGSSVPSLRLSAAAAAREAFDVIIAVNQWPHSFCYSITAQQSVSDAVVKESEFDVYFLEADPVLVGTRDETLHVSIGCGISDPSFAYGHDKLILGIDGNGDRYLTPDETQQILSQPVDISLHFAGVDPAGNLQVGNTVVDAKFPLRTKDLVDGRHSLLACLRQGETETMSTPRELIVDRQPPTLARLEVENDSPLVSGQVASFRIRGSDAGLSGVQTVKIAWSQDGKMELPSKPPPVSCVQNEVGDWIGQLPTAGRPPGMWTVLAIATDRVGNASEIKTRVVQVWTAEQLAAQRRRQVGSVAGRVIYADVPVPNLSVKLSPVIDSDNKPSPETAGKTSGASDKTSGNANVRSAAVHTQTDAQGRYQFQDVPPGRYEIQLHGIYRGMTRRQATRIDVAPQQVQRLPDMVIR